jgi:hypothetical protein
MIGVKVRLLKSAASGYRRARHDSLVTELAGYELMNL